MSRSRDELRRSSIFLWNWQSGPERRFLKDQTFGIRYFQWSTDRKRLLVVSNGKIIDAKGGQISLFGKQYIGQGCDGEVSLWDAQSGTRLVVLPALASRDSLPFFCENDQAILLCPDNEGYIGVFDASTGKLRRKYDAKSMVTGTWQQALLTQDGGTLIGRRHHHNSPVFFWNARTGESRGKTDVPESSGTFYLFELSPDSRTVAVTADSVALLIDVSSGRVTHYLRGHENLIRCMKFSPDSRFLLTGSDDKSATLWNVESGKIVHVYKGHPEAVMNIAWSPSGSHLATQSTDRHVRIWPVQLMPLLEKRIQREFTLAERQRYELVSKPQQAR